MKFGLIGNPVSHSLSPMLFRAAYPSSADTYDLIEAIDFVESVKKFKTEGYDGINITAPYKELITTIGARAEEEVLNIGAGNTLVYRDKKLVLFNTDIHGVWESLSGFITEGSDAVVLGYGGAGKSAAYILSKKGLKVKVINRSPAKGRGFDWEKQIEFMGPESLNKILKISGTVINTLPVLPEFLKEAEFSGKVILDANYTGKNLSFARLHPGVIYLPGTLWLLNQAIASYRIFTGREPDRDSMRLFTDNL